MELTKRAMKLREDYRIIPFLIPDYVLETNIRSDLKHCENSRSELTMIYKRVQELHTEDMKEHPTFIAEEKRLAAKKVGDEKRAPMKDDKRTSVNMIIDKKRKHLILKEKSSLKKRKHSVTTK